MSKERCFVVMPYGEKPDEGGSLINFDSVYSNLIKPAVADAGLDCLRCDNIDVSGAIHAKMIEHLFRDAVVVVDITTLNANVFYELGVRHALRSHVTILIRKHGTKLPFNIQDMNVIGYDMSSDELIGEGKRRITNQIRSGLRESSCDSLVHDVLNIRVTQQAKVLTQTQRIAYKLPHNPSKRIWIITGDLQNITGIDVWVSSENTNMQLARFFDRSVSGVVRYLGAEKDEAGTVITDLIADAVSQKVSKNITVPPGTIVATTSGSLEHTHGVKQIFHAAAVAGAVGHGYSPIPKVAVCITNALNKADSPLLRPLGLKSILFPLLGTGTARGDPFEIINELIQTAFTYLSNNPECTIENVYFLAWHEEDFEICKKALNKLNDSH